MKGRLMLSLSLCVAATAFRYSLPFGTGPGGRGPSNVAQRAVSVTEGPMYANGAGPFPNGPSEVGVDFAATSLLPTDSGAVRFHVVIADAANKALVGYSTGDPDGTVVLCCSSLAFHAGTCGPSAQPGDVIVQGPTDGANGAVLVKSVTASAGDTAPVTGSAVRPVTAAGSQFVWLVMCNADGMNGDVPALPINVNLEFRNPYGYLPGQLFAVLPVYATLTITYALLVVVFAGAAIWQRKYLMNLHFVVLGVIALGLLESAVLFGMYNSKNVSGVPTPCYVCAVTSDYMAATVIQVVKRAGSRVLYLLLCLGYGIVTPTLSKKQIGGIAALIAVYFTLALTEAILKKTTYDDSGSGIWELVLSFLDIGTFWWMYASLMAMKRQLQARGETTKLRMYDQLLVVIYANALLYIAVAVVEIVAGFGAIAYPWQAYGFFSTLYDDMYFFVFAAIAWIWAPGQQSFQYSLYSQALGDVDTAGVGGGDAHADNSFTGGGGVELSAVRVASSASADEEAFDEFGGGTRAKAPPAAAGSFVIEEEEEEGAAAPPAPAAAAAAASGGSSSAPPASSPKAPAKLLPPPAAAAKRPDGLAAQAEGGASVDTSAIEP